MNKIRVQTQSKYDRPTKKEKITTKHWLIYYQLMSISKYNAQRVEDHRFVYKKDINISKMCRDCGIKSSKTFYNAIDRLSKWGLVSDMNNYFLLYAPNYIEIAPRTLKTFLSYTTEDTSHIDILRVFLILKKMDSVAENGEDRSFTIRSIVKLLSHGTSNTCSYLNIRFYLAMLSYWGLISLKYHTMYNSNLKPYLVYHLQWVKETELSKDFIDYNQEAEEQAPLMSDKMMEKLKMCFPIIMEDSTEE